MDTPTLFINAACIDIVLAAVMAYVYLTQTTYRGFSFWMAGAVCQACGLLLLATGGFLTPVVSSLLASSLTAASAVLYHWGLCRFTGQDDRVPVLDALVYGASFTVFAWFLFVQDWVTARIVAFSLCVVFVCGRMVVSTVRGLSGRLRVDGLFLAGLFALTAVANLVRGAVAMLPRPGPEADLLHRGSGETAALLGMTVLSTCVIAAFLIITMKRVRLDLEFADAHVRQLEGILPICMYCKKIRDEGNAWHKLENYLGQRTQAQFSHGMCPECEHEHFPPDGSEPPPRER